MTRTVWKQLEEAERRIDSLESDAEHESANTKERKGTKDNGISGKSLNSRTRLARQGNSLTTDIFRFDLDHLEPSLLFRNLSRALASQNRWQSLDFWGKTKNIDGVKRKRKLGMQSTWWDVSVETNILIQLKKSTDWFSMNEISRKTTPKNFAIAFAFRYFELAFLMSTDPPKWFFTTKT